MKILTKIKLINWHYFNNEDIEINKSTLFSGENSSGKSTILDAIKFALTTNSGKFNQAANEKGTRDLKGYVRCKTGSEENAYNRKGSVISYVAMQFYDDVKKNNFTIGVKCDSVDEMSRVKAKWFLEDTDINNITFIKNNKPSEDKELLNNNRKIQLFENKRDAKDRIKRRLGNFTDSYFDLLQKALAFRPMNDIKEFINDFVLQEDNVEVDRLQGALNSIKEFENLLKECKDKLAYINRVLETQDDIDKKQKEILISDCMVLKINLLTIENDISLKTDLLNKTILYNNFKQQEKDKFTKECYELSEKISDLRAQLKTLDSSVRLNNIENLLSNVNDKLESTNKTKKDFLEQIAVFRNLSKHCDLSNYIDAIFSENQNLSDRESAYSSAIKEINRFNANSQQLLVDLNFKKKNAASDIQSTKDKIDKLNKNKFTYSNSLYILKDAINKELELRGKTDRVKILCELLNIEDETWRNAIEGYLNTQKFYLLVEKENFDIALEVYNRLKKEVSGVGLINLKYINECAQVANSLAQKVTSFNEGAKNYVDYLLGKVMCVEDVKELSNHNIAITKSCMLYKNYVARRLSYESYKNPFIGKQAYEMQLETAKEELIKLENGLKLIESQISPINEFMQKSELVNKYLLSRNLNIFDLIKGLNIEKAELLKEKQELEKDPSIIDIQIKIEADTKLLTEKNKKKDELFEIVARNKEKIERLQKEIFNCKELLKDEENKYRAKIDDNSDIEQVVEERIIKLDNIEQAKINHENRKKALYTQLDNVKNKLIERQTEYNSKFQEDYTTGSSSIEKFRNAKINLESTIIAEQEDKIAKAKKEAEIQFHTSFIGELKNKIQECKDYFKKLNQALKNIPFGDEYYSFEVTPAKSKRALHDMIMDENNFVGENMFTSLFEDKYKEEMDDLFAKLKVENDDLAKEYCDYRKYLDYDIKVKKGDIVMKLSKNLKEKSGGETQTAFYVVIAASFYNAFNQNTPRLILFDEAFNQMSQDRIASVFSFFKTMNFQILLATPPEKMETIGESVETINFVHRSGTSATVIPYMEV